MKIITLNNVKFKNLYYENIEISNKITFIKGKSGVGKSTLFRLLNKTISPDSGEILYNNKNINDIDPINLRQEILLINQQPYLFKGSVLENFEIYNSYRHKKLIIDEIYYFLNITCIDININKDVKFLSGGERQRVFTAIFLSFYPKVFLLDEITSALDRKTAINMTENIINFSKQNNITDIFISHLDELADKFGEDIVNVGE